MRFLKLCIANAPGWHNKICRIIHTVYYAIVTTSIVHISVAIVCRRCKNVSVCFEHDLFMHTYLLISVFRKETGAKCNPIYVLSTIITITATKMLENTFKCWFLSSLPIYLFIEK
jgi:ABC-type uncharacterized transport system permease subunit